MKKKILGFTLVLFAALVLVACKPKADDAQLVADAKEALTVQAEVSADFKVAAADGDVAIAWESDNTRILTVGATANNETTITVSRPAADTTVNLEATLTLGEESDTKSFPVKVLGTGEEVTEVTVTFTVTLPANSPEGDVFVVGDLKHADTASWDPGAESGKMTRDGNTATFTLVYDADDLPLDIQYKYTMGSWDAEELMADGNPTENRTATITAVGSTMAINDTVALWRIPQLFADGQYNFRFADSELRHTFFAAAEGYLLDNVAGGVPLFANSGAALYSSRVNLPVENYVPVMGWGSAFGTLTADDSTVQFSGDRTGVAGQHTYRGAFTSNPTTFNQWIADDSVSSDAMAFMLDSLYAFVFNSEYTAYEVAPSMADALPTPLNPETVGDLTVSDSWSVPVKDGLKWFFHPNADAALIADLDTDIDANTFVDTFRYALETGWFRAISGGGHFWAATNNVVGAQAFRNFVTANPDATESELDTEWAKVGIKVVDGNIEFEFNSQLSEWNLIYWLSSNTMSPVHLEMLERLEADNSTYAATAQTMAYTGPYYLHEYEADKLLEFRTNPEFHTPSLYNYDGYYFVIIERAEIVFAEFEAGHLDVAGLPLTKYEQYKNDEGLRRSPGATTFRMNINGLGTVENQQKQFPSGPGNSWVPEPLLSNLNMKKALYWAVDRQTLAWDILKTSDPQQFYFSDAYLVDPASGTAFRQTPQGLELGEDLSTDTYGFNKELAESYFDTAVAELVAAGQLNLGTAANPTVIELDLSIQAASTSQAQLAEFLKNSFESTFNNRPNSPHLSIDITIDPVTFPDNYYARTIPGRFDLGTGGISGSTLDAASFLEVFASDNRGGFTIDWGFDTSIANIPVSYTYNGEDIVDEYWSFDAIVSALNGPVTVVEGVEALDSTAIEAVEALIDALPEAEDYVHATHKAALEAADAAFYALLPRAQAEVSNADKLAEVTDAYLAAAAAAAVAEVDDAIEALDEESTDEDVLDALELFEDLSAANKAAVKAANVEALGDLVAPLVLAAIDAIPAEVTLDDSKTVAAANTLNNRLEDLVGEEAAAELVNAAAVKEITDAQSAIKVLTAIKAIDDLTELLPVEEVVLTSRYDIQATRGVVAGLSAAEQELVTNIADLVALEAAVKPLVDAEEAFLWTLGVGSLPDANDINSGHRVQVEIVIAGFNALSDEAKVLEYDAVAHADYEEFDVAAALATLQDIIDVLEETIDDLDELELPGTED